MYFKNGPLNMMEISIFVEEIDLHYWEAASKMKRQTFYMHISLYIKHIYKPYFQSLRNHSSQLMKLYLTCYVCVVPMMRLFHCF